MRKRLRKKGQILVENVMFLVLNLIFLSILILFVYSKSGGDAILEEKYAKQIALIIDSAKPEMEIHLNMEDAFREADKNNFDKKNIVSVSGNTVTVKLRGEGGYSYEFFNNVAMENVYPIDTDNDKNADSYRIKITGYAK